MLTEIGDTPTRDTVRQAPPGLSTVLSRSRRWHPQAPGARLPDTHARYRRLVNRPDGILIAEDERIAFVNPAAVGLFGANGPDQLLGRSLLDLFHAENHGSVREHFLHWRAGRTALPLDAKIVPPDGRVRDISVTGAQVADEGDRAIQLIVRDITEQKAAERALRESEERSPRGRRAQEGVWDWNLETNAVVYSTRWKQMPAIPRGGSSHHVSAWERSGSS